MAPKDQLACTGTSYLPSRVTDRGSARRIKADQQLNKRIERLAPLYVGYVDVWNAVEALHQVLVGHEWQRAEFQTREIVT